MIEQFAGNPQTLLKEAITLHRTGQIDAAERLYRQLIDVRPALADPRHMLGVLRLQQGQNAEALELIQAALKIDSSYGGAWADFGYAQTRLGRFAEAVTSFDRVLAITPNSVACLHYRALSLQALKQFVRALEDYDKALALEPNFFESLYNRGVLLWEMERYQDALDSLEKAVALQPAHAEAWNNRGNVLRNLKRNKEALSSFEKALSLKPSLVSAAYNRANLLFQDMKRAEEAIIAYDRVLAGNPNFVEAWVNRGAALSMMGRLPESLVSLDRALMIRPDFSPGMNCRGLVLFADGRTQDGMASFMRSAQQAYGGEERSSKPKSPDFKVSHDCEQQEYLESVKGRFSERAGAGVTGPAVSRGNATSVEHWLTKTPQIVVIDDLLTPEALSGLRRFCLESPVWRAAHEDGYLGAFPEHGFACPLLGQIAEELREVFPTVFRDHTLRYLWGFKFDSRLSGVKIHADEAAVNVNFWLTPNESNLDPESGGLIIWDVAAPQNEKFPIFNGDVATTRDYLARSGAKSMTIPYRANRAVIFDSDLFHETDKIHFKEGYFNRRINVAMLFGIRS